MYPSYQVTISNKYHGIERVTPKTQGEGGGRPLLRDEKEETAIKGCDGSRYLSLVYLMELLVRRLAVSATQFWGSVSFRGFAKLKPLHSYNQERQFREILFIVALLDRQGACRKFASNKAINLFQ